MELNSTLVTVFLVTAILVALLVLFEIFRRRP